MQNTPIAIARRRSSGRNAPSNPSIAASRCPCSSFAAKWPASVNLKRVTRPSWAPRSMSACRSNPSISRTAVGCRLLSLDVLPTISTLSTSTLVRVLCLNLYGWSNPYSRFESIIFSSGIASLPATIASLQEARNEEPKYKVDGRPAGRPGLRLGVEIGHNLKSKLPSTHSARLDGNGTADGFKL